MGRHEINNQTDNFIGISILYDSSAIFMRERGKVSSDFMHFGGIYAGIGFHRFLEYMPHETKTIEDRNGGFWEFTFTIYDSGFDVDFDSCGTDEPIDEIIFDPAI